MFSTTITTSPTVNTRCARGVRCRRRRRGSHATVNAKSGENDAGFLNSLKKLNRFAKKETSVERARRDEVEASTRQMTEAIFGKGLGGKVMGAMVNKVAGSLREQMAAAGEASAEAYDDAVRAIKLDRELENALGGEIECGPVMSQSSSSSVVNGKKTSKIVIGFAVQSRRTGRRAFVQAESDGENTVVSARDDAGRVFQIGTSSGAKGSGNTYDEVFDIDPNDVIDV